MISVIISSADSNLLRQVSENITSTIGLPFEIIAIDNSQGKQGLCAVYNQGSAKAKYDILCFMHEDVIIKTNNWGSILKNIFFDNSEIGLIGIVGSGYKPFTPSGWTGIDSVHIRANILQSYKYLDKPQFHDYKNPDNLKREQVACVDGVFLSTTKKAFLEFKFDETLFNGFHGYDIDISIAIGQKYKVVVTYEILLNHLSEGSYSREWVEDMIKLHEKWKLVLPINVNNISFNECRQIEKRTFNDLISLLTKFDIPLSVANKILSGNKKYRELKLFWKLKFLIYKTYLK
ncbi:glycosyltransferase [Mucilaginibacter sp.]